MPFQIRCPQGCLLTVDEAHAGWQCQCPVCGAMFVVPPPPSFPAPAVGPGTFQPPGPSSQPGTFPQAGAGPFTPAPQESAMSPFPAGAAMQQPAAPRDAPAEVKEPEILHIPCPNGHELEVPTDMLEQEAMCPHCNAQFRLRKKDSVEYKEKRRKEAELRQRRADKAWLNWSIVAAVLVLLGLGLLIFLSS